MSKNIEINYKDDAGYEVLYPQSISNIVYLSSTVEALFNYSSGALLDEALVQLYLGTGKYGYSIHVQCPDGSPVLGAIITGIDHPDGSSQIITNEEGNAIGVSLNTSVNLQIQSPYLDMQDASVQVNSEKALTEYTVTLQPTGELTISTSVSAKTSPYLASFDLCGVGAGGGGGGYDEDPSSLGSGGGGGYVVNVMSYEAVANANINCIVGSGGKAGAYSNRQGTDGGDGGSTQVVYIEENILLANGGKGGLWSRGGDPEIKPGGVGNGDGGCGSGDPDIAPNLLSGKDGATIYKFNEQVLGIPGGGGGGGGKISGSTPALGGSPNGANGANEDNASTAGIGGGGGGAMRSSSSRWYASAGGNGVLYFRPTYKS